jgi:hypothetical protein
MSKFDIEALDHVYEVALSIVTNRPIPLLKEGDCNTQIELRQRRKLLQLAETISEIRGLTTLVHNPKRSF